MKSLPKFMLVFVVCGIIYALSTGISLHEFTGIEDGIIKGSLSNNALFGTIERAKNITIGSNLVGLLLIAILWCTSLQKDSEPDL